MYKMRQSTRQKKQKEKHDDAEDECKQGQGQEGSAALAQHDTSGVTGGIYMEELQEY